VVASDCETATLFRLQVKSGEGSSKACAQGKQIELEYGHISKVVLYFSFSQARMRAIELYDLKGTVSMRTGHFSCKDDKLEIYLSKGERIVGLRAHSPDPQGSTLYDT